jgi:hypothetical protein
LSIEKGSIVEWKVLGSKDNTYGGNSDYEEDIFEMDTRHAISFEYAPLASAKSPLLKINDVFRVRFLEPGVYHYRCQIYPRMRGTVQVFESSSAALLFQSSLNTALHMAAKQAVFSAETVNFSIVSNSG